MTTKRKGSRTPKAEPGENPLIPNSKLRQLYTSMVEARLLDRHLAKLQRRLKPAKRLESTFGQEACRVATAIELKAGDLISERSPSPVTRLILGADPGSVLRDLALKQKNTRKRTTTRRRQAEGIAKQLPSITDAAERLRTAMGAALALKLSAPGHVVVAYADHRELRVRDWRTILTSAAKLELPVIFVVLPAAPKRKTAADMIICAKVGSTGVPCIPVDSADAVALFRVTQESLGRTRGGDGPVLIECLAYRERNQTTQHDPLVQMKRFLLQRKVSNQRSLDVAGRRFQLQTKRLKS
jgi:TPP-dependent pyruvate/acetoin dehydrogenase alpha subunit